jgi:thiol-disulfide isomerase/thioredoxin
LSDPFVGRPTAGGWRFLTGTAVLLAVIAGVASSASIFMPRPEARSPRIRPAAIPGHPDQLLLDSSLTRESVSLLFFEGRPAVLGRDGRRVVVSESGTLLATSSTLDLRPLSLGLGGRGALAAAPASDGGWWISTLDGELLKIAPGGEIAFVRPAPFGATALWPDPRSDGVIATRSPERFGFVPEAPENPAIVEVDGQGRVAAGRGKLLVPEHSLLATLANSGYAVATGDTVFLAPLSRSEVIALGPKGDTLWRSAATEVPPTPEPRIKLVEGQVRIDYQPLNLAMTLGPDGRLYVLRATDTTLRRARLDVLDRSSGQVLWRADLAGPRATLAANRLGRVYAFEGDRLLGAIAPSARERFPDFDLPARGGGQVSRASLAGKVVLINVWASWCVPCRTEMPALDSLQRSLQAPEFAFLAISEDERRSDAERFLQELGLEFPVVFGDGRLRNLLHYPGLPYTLLVDREGRILRRWIGQLAGPDFELIRMLARQESGAPALAPSGAEPHHHHPGPQARRESL